MGTSSYFPQNYPSKVGSWSLSYYSRWHTQKQENFRFWSASFELFHSFPKASLKKENPPVSLLTEYGMVVLLKVLQKVHIWAVACLHACSVLSNCCDPMDCGQQASLSGNFLSKNTGVDCHFFLQGIFLSQGLNTCVLHFRQILYHWATERKPWAVEGEIKITTKERYQPKLDTLNWDCSLNEANQPT